MLQTDDVLPSLEEQGVRQLYPKDSNIGLCIGFSVMFNSFVVFVEFCVCVFWKNGRLQKGVESPESRPPAEFLRIGRCSC